MSDEAEIIQSRSLSQGNLSKTPDFYKSMAYTGSGRQRLRGLQVNNALPKVVQYIEGVVAGSVFPSTTVYYDRSFKNIVSVNGVLETPSGAVIPLYPGSNMLYFDNVKVIVGSPFFTTLATAGSKFRLRVYSAEL